MADSGPWSGEKTIYDRTVWRNPPSAYGEVLAENVPVVYYDLNGDYASVGVAWTASEHSTYVTLAPKLVRWDKYSTNNYGGSFRETLSPDPNGTNSDTGSWRSTSNNNQGVKDWSGWYDSWATRTYYRQNTAYDVSFTVSWDSDEFYTYDQDGSGNGGSFGARSFTFKYTIPALPYNYITYNANGGFGAPAQHRKQNDNSIRIADAPYRVGYKFIKWNTSQDGTGTSYNPGQLYSTNSDLTLYAQWEQEKIVDNIDVSNSKQRYIPSKLLPSICTKIGQKFYGDVLYENNNTISWGTYVSDSSLWSSFTFLNNKKCSDYKRIVIKADTYHGTKIVIEILDPCPNKIFMFTDNFIYSDDAHTLYLRSIQYKFSNDGTGIELDGYRGQRTFKENTASAYTENCYFCIRKIIGFKN